MTRILLSLFILVFDMVTRLMDRAKDVGLVDGFEIGRTKGLCFAFTVR